MPRVAVLLTIFWLVLAAVLQAQDAQPKILTKCAEVRALPPEEAARGLDVGVRGVVSFIPSSHVSLTIDDGTGVWVNLQKLDQPQAMPANLQVGDLIEIRGKSHEGLFSPIVVASEVRRVGRGSLPPAQLITPLGLESGMYSSQRVVINGVVQSAETSLVEGLRELRLIVSTPVGRFSYVLRGAINVPPAELVDSEVSLTGVFLPLFNARRQFLGVRICSNLTEDLQIIDLASSEAFAAPEVALGAIMRFSPERANQHRRRVKGVVTLCRPGQYFFIQDKRHALRISTRQSDDLQPGDVVEVSGFFRLQNYRAEMHEAVFRRLDRISPPEPIEINREQAMTREPLTAYLPPQDFDDRLVSLRGRFVSLVRGDDSSVRLNLECHGVLVPAEFEGGQDVATVEFIRPGSELIVSGVCALTYSEANGVMDWPRPVALRLLLRSPSDAKIVRAASWWTTDRLWMAFGLTAIVLLVSLTWSVLLRRTVALRGAQLAEEMRLRRDAAVDFESTLRERNRIAADLHDTTEQSLSGLAFQLEASEALQIEAPARSQQHLTLARQLLDRSREDLRRSIWNLRASLLEEDTLFGALQKIALDRGAGQTTRIVVESEGALRPLPDSVADNLLLLAQEGITNALKHAKAQQICLKLKFSDRAVTLSIYDDGQGFDPVLAAGTKEGHFGLRGMRERSKHLGGDLQITSNPGAGTTILVTVQVR